MALDPLLDPWDEPTQATAAARVRVVREETAASALEALDYLSGGGAPPSARLRAWELASAGVLRGASERPVVHRSTLAGSLGGICQRITP